MAGVRDRRDDLLHSRFVFFEVYGDVGTSFGKRDRNRAPYPAAATSYQGKLSAEFNDPIIPLLRVNIPKAAAPTTCKRIANAADPQL